MDANKMYIKNFAEAHGTSVSFCVVANEMEEWGRDNYKTLPVHQSWERPRYHVNYGAGD